MANFNGALTELRVINMVQSSIILFAGDSRLIPNKNLPFILKFVIYTLVPMALFCPPVVL